MFFFSVSLHLFRFVSHVIDLAYSVCQLYSLQLQMMVPMLLRLPSSSQKSSSTLSLLDLTRILSHLHCLFLWFNYPLKFMKRCNHGDLPAGLPISDFANGISLKELIDCSFHDVSECKVGSSQHHLSIPLSLCPSLFLFISGSCRHSMDVLWTTVIPSKDWESGMVLML